MIQIHPIGKMHVIPGVKYDHVALEVRKNRLEEAAHIFMVLGFKVESQEEGPWGESVTVKNGKHLVQLHVSAEYRDKRKKTDNHAAVRVKDQKIAYRYLTEWARLNDLKIQMIKEDDVYLVYFPEILFFFIELKLKKKS